MGYLYLLAFTIALDPKNCSWQFQVTETRNRSAEALKLRHQGVEA